jgi:hypothetical protein
LLLVLSLVEMWRSVTMRAAEGTRASMEGNPCDTATGVGLPIKAHLAVTVYLRPEVCTLVKITSEHQ